jgi:N-acetylglutamate synthase-like GNAT family acetyltransferase
VAELTIRAADPGDADDIASLHAAAWQAAFTFLPARFLQDMTADVVVGKWKDDLASAATSMFVAIYDGSVVGFVQLRVDGHQGEVLSVYVDPSSWSHGVGSSLLAFGESWLQARGVHTAVLWTATESRQSRGFYEHRGWSASGSHQVQHLGRTGAALHEVEYRKRLR